MDAVNLMDGPAFKMLSANLQMIMAVHKTQGEFQHSDYWLDTNKARKNTKDK